MVPLSVADPECLSRIPDPDFYPSRIQKQQQKRGVKKKLSSYLFLQPQKFHKIENYFIFEMLKKNNLGQFSKNYRTFYPKICHQALKNMGLGSGIRDPGSEKIRKKVRKSSYEMKKDENRLKRKEKLKLSKMKNKRRV